MSDDPSRTHAALAGPWLESNTTAFAVAGPEAGTLLISTRRAVDRWAALSAEERGDVLALVDALGGPAGRVDFDLAPPGGRWYLRLRRDAGAFAGLPGFVAGEEQHLLPALRGALARADEADLLSAFVQRSGVQLLRDDLEDALRRGVRVRVLTGDYLGLTAVDALRDLDAMRGEFAGLEVAVYQCEGNTSFHPKAYIFSAGTANVAYVGSSNLSRSALLGGVEWNLRAIDDTRELAAIRGRFQRLWDAPRTVPLTPEWIAAYAARVPVAPEWDPPAQPPTPHGIQLAALAALAQTWARAAERGLVVLATGLGKTLLAAFAAQQMGARRVLFVVHRGEILTQARRAFEWVFPTRSTGLFKGDRRDAAAELLFASVQTLSRPEHLGTWPKDHFDLIVIDEFHHAAALSYRRILHYFAPRFLLGITATPERGDGAALLDLCGDNLVFRADLAQGIACGRLVPFTYHGLKDSIDYQAIPWRSGRFDPAALTAALATRSHAEQALAGYREHAPPTPRRGLWFCASIAHAEFMAKFLDDRGVRAVAVHSEKGGAPRGESLRRLMAGELEAITTVDVFNEGVDVPDINVVVLLRPTESRVIFLQQIGRGLRLPERSSKPRLVILDFIGNHRSFLGRPQALFGLLGSNLGGRAAVRGLRERDYALPPGCSVEIETEVIDLLTRLARDGGGDRMSEIFRRLRDELGRRPTLAEFAAEGEQAAGVAREFGTWWDFLAREHELGEDEARVLAGRHDELAALEAHRGAATAPWPVMRAWIDLGGALRPVVEAELQAALADPNGRPAAALAKLWPAGLALRAGVLSLRTPLDAADGQVLEAMLDEICEARANDTATVRQAGAMSESGGVIVARVIPTTSSVMLRFDCPPELRGRAIEVSVEGEPYTLHFVKMGVNKAVAREGGKNVLRGILRGLFGEHAGASGTNHRVVLREEGGGWTLSPSLAQAAAPPPIPYYADLAVACGLGDVQHADADNARTIRIRSEHVLDPRRHFVVRARGDSMDGGRRPIRDGDLVLCARLASPDLEVVAGKPCLIVVDHGPDASEALIKAPIRVAEKTWVLRSWSKGQVDLPIARPDAFRVAARVVGVVQAEPDAQR